MLTRFALIALVLLHAGAAGAQDVLVGVASADTGIVVIDPVSLGRVVTGAPYTAEAVTEITQILADGNRIEQRTTATVARDSRGRTRRDQQGVAFGPFVAQNPQPIVTIVDPDAGVHITLNHDRKIAFRSRLPRFERVRGAPAVADPPVAEAGAMITFEVAAPADSAGMTEPPAFAMLGAPTEPYDVQTVALPPRIIEGLPAVGSRTIMIIPAGAVGNQHPIDVISERWHSPDLQVVLLTRRSDPRFGETVYRLTSIRRDEPAPALFEPPPDYRVQDVGPGARPLRPEVRQ